jgi:Domain of unknown function (DUF4304)
MVDSSADSFHASFGRIAKDIGLAAKGRHWFRTTDETVTVFGLQKSQYADRYYLNIGVMIRALDPKPYPTPTNCHVMFRAGDLLAADANVLAKALDLIRPLDVDVRMAVLREIMVNDLAPWIDRLGSLAELRTMGDLLSHSAVRVAARGALGLHDR